MDKFIDWFVISLIQLSKEEEEEMNAELEMIKGQLRVINEDRQRLQIFLNEKSGKADKAKKRFVPLSSCIYLNQNYQLT